MQNTSNIFRLLIHNSVSAHFFPIHIWLASLMAISLICIPAKASDDLANLYILKTELEGQLKALNERISTLETAQNTTLVNTASAKFFIKDFGIDTVNSAGGVEPYFVFFNPNPNTAIKYLTVDLTLYNAVGDRVSSSIGRETTARLRYTGPLTNADGEKKTYWRPVWYNSTGHCIRVESVAVTFMDGKLRTFAGRTLLSALAPELTNDCKVRS
jgi:hypothetical protein